MCALCRKWFDRFSDIVEDFDYRDFFWCEMLVLSLGIIFGISTSKVMKYIYPIIVVFAVFSAFKVFYPRREKLGDMITGKYEDRFVEYSDSDDIPDFI